MLIEKIKKEMKHIMTQQYKNILNQICLGQKCG